MNKLERLDYPLKTLPSGQQTFLTLFRIRGNSEGPHCHIQASVHGAEVQGNAVIYHLLDYFLNHSFNGSITLIPMANPTATNMKIGSYTYGRFNPGSGDNWNRNYTDLVAFNSQISNMPLDKFIEKCQQESLDQSEIKKRFKSELIKGVDSITEYYSSKGLSENHKLNLILQKIAAPADIVLDLHTGAHATRYLYSAEYQKESAKHFLFPHVILIPHKFAGAMDEATFMPWLELEKQCQEQSIEFKQDFESYTVELGSEERISISEAKEDTKRILNYLHSKGMVNEHSGIWAGDQYYCALSDLISYFAPKGGLYEYCAGPAQKVSSGEVLYRVLNFQNLQTESGFDEVLLEASVENDCIIINQQTSACVGEGGLLYQVMENYQKY